MHESYKELASDLQLENIELRSQLRESTQRALAEEREKVDYRMQLKFARDALRESGNVAGVVRYADGTLECGECGSEVARDWWAFCPSCGKWLDRDDVWDGEAA